MIVARVLLKAPFMINDPFLLIYFYIFICLLNSEKSMKNVIQTTLVRIAHSLKNKFIFLFSIFKNNYSKFSN